MTGRNPKGSIWVLQLLKFEAAALHWSCYTTGDETEVQASQ